MKYKFLFILASSLFCSALLSAQMMGLTEPAWVYIGDAKRAMAKGEQHYALDILNKTLIAYPDNADAYFLRAMIYEHEADDPSTPGGMVAYRMAVLQYENAITYASNLSIPAYKLDAYFKLIYIFERTLDEVKYIETEKAIIDLANSTFNKKERGRIHFRLAEHYSMRSRDTTAMEYYRLSYEDGYRQKLSLFRMSLIHRKMRDYVREKERLLLASRYRFDFEEPSNFDVERAIIKRLDDLRNIVLPSRFY